MLIHDDVAYHDYEGVALDHDERPRLLKDMGTKNLMILRNHGTLTVGKTCADAFLRLYYLERSCTIQVRALAGGSKINPTHQGVPEKTGELGSRSFDGMIGNLAWPGLLRTLDRKDTSYRN
jgi:ribulose-5-phosphate 4-epimerase/fuculose-1-phosphate aldolase